MSNTAATAPEISHPSQLPAVDKVLLSTQMQALRESYGLDACTQAVRDVLTGLRQLLLGSAEQAAQSVQADITSIVQSAQRQLQGRFAPRLRPVFNLTGTVLHTNLGRALLPQAAIDAVVQAMAGHVLAMAN